MQIRRPCNSDEKFCGADELGILTVSMDAGCRNARRRKIEDEGRFQGATCVADGCPNAFLAAWMPLIID